VPEEIDVDGPGVIRGSDAGNSQRKIIKIHNNRIIKDPIRTVVLYSCYTLFRFCFLRTLQISRKFRIRTVQIMIKLSGILLINFIDGPHRIQLLQPLLYLASGFELIIIWRFRPSGQTVHQITQEGLQLVDGPLFEFDGIHRRDEMLDRFRHGDGVRTPRLTNGFRNAHAQQSICGTGTIHLIQLHERLDRSDIVGIIAQGGLFGQSELRNELVAFRRVFLVGDHIAGEGAFQVLRGQDDSIQGCLVVIDLAFFRRRIQSDFFVHVQNIHDDGIGIGIGIGIDWF
jgi:hypothetical protein